MKPLESYARNRMRRLLPVLLVAFGLSACAPPLKLGEPAALPTQFHEVAPVNADTQPALSDAELARWWTQFNDPLLTQLIEQALAHNYDIALAAARIDQARAGVRFAWSQLLPSVGAGVEGGSYHGGATALEFQELLGIDDLNAQFWRVGLQTQWEIDVFGRGRARLSAAHALTAAAVGDAQAVRLATIAVVADLYTAYRGLQEQRTLLEKSHQVAADFVVIAQHSYDAGAVLSTDIDAARAGLAQVDARREEIGMTLTQTRLALEQLCAVAPGTYAAGLEEEQRLPQPLAAIAPGQPVDLLMRRPDLIAARARLLASVNQSDAARLNYWPTVSLSALLARNGWTIAGRSLGPSTFWLFGAALSLPLIDFGARRSQVEANDAQAYQAFVAYEKTAQGALYDVEQALGRLARQQQLQTARAQEVTHRSDVLAKTMRQYQVGNVGRLDIDQARVALLNSQSALVTGDMGLIQAQVALFRAMGGGWQAAAAPQPATDEPGPSAAN
ncbi:efflux transporter outer membrane subunit [Paraburkholderia sp. IMGN_8]|uniref:efflux transporter outer membrane subunit n=1 Tax=Paraburkholderia sp. IMGN_8 TaxID=3136564 RepID=UPI003100F3F3